MDGVFIGGCHLNECHYLTDGNYHAFSMVLLARKLMENMGLDPKRLWIEWTSAGEGIRFAEIMTDFHRTIKELGPLGHSEGLDAGGLRVKLEAATQLVPYIRVVRRQRMRLPLKSEEEYLRYFSSEEFEKIFSETIADRMATSQIALLLRESPMATGEIAKTLGLTASEVSRHLAASTKQGLVRYDAGSKCYAAA
jgi:DNA-binding transcriptional ArsR family regulator